MSEKQQDALLRVALPAFLCGGVIGWLLSRWYDRHRTENSPIKSTGGSIKVWLIKDLNWAPDPDPNKQFWTVNVGKSIKRVTLAGVRGITATSFSLTLKPGWKIKIGVHGTLDNICLQYRTNNVVSLELTGQGNFSEEHPPGWHHHVYHHPEGDPKEHMGNIVVACSGSDKNASTFDSLRDPLHPTEICLWTP